MVEKSKSYPRIINFLLQFSFDSSKREQSTISCRKCNGLETNSHTTPTSFREKGRPGGLPRRKHLPRPIYTLTLITSALMTISLRPIFFSNAFPDPRNIRRSNHRGANITSFRSLPSLPSFPPSGRSASYFASIIPFPS